MTSSRRAPTYCGLLWLRPWALARASWQPLRPCPKANKRRAKSKRQRPTSWVPDLMALETREFPGAFLGLWGLTATAFLDQALAGPSFERWQDPAAGSSRHSSDLLAAADPLTVAQLSPPPFAIPQLPADDLDHERASAQAPPSSDEPPVAADDPLGRLDNPLDQYYTTFDLPNDLN